MTISTRECAHGCVDGAVSTRGCLDGYAFQPSLKSRSTTGSRREELGVFARCSVPTHRYVLSRNAIVSCCTASAAPDVRIGLCCAKRVFQGYTIKATVPVALERAVGGCTEHCNRRN